MKRLFFICLLVASCSKPAKPQVDRRLICGPGNGDSWYARKVNDKPVCYDEDANNPRFQLDGPLEEE